MGSAFFRWWLEYFSIGLVSQGARPLPDRQGPTGPPFDKQTMAMAFLHLSQGYFNRKTNIFHSQVSVPNIECEPSDKSICALEIGSSLAGIEKYRYLSAFYHI
jgi:hypothetical protein